MPISLVREEMTAVLGRELLVFADHEQYFHRHYFAYQPDYVEKIFIAAKMAADANYGFAFIEDTAVA